MDFFVCLSAGLALALVCLIFEDMQPDSSQAFKVEIKSNQVTATVNSSCQNEPSFAALITFVVGIFTGVVAGAAYATNISRQHQTDNTTTEQTGEAPTHTNRNGRIGEVSTAHFSMGTEKFVMLKTTDDSPEVQHDNSDEDMEEPAYFYDDYDIGSTLL